eukprot:CAMPEP_0172534224 /NCGR_PEP_ID=MMETSP1067-20121228/6671_1 /TAXON_ID=265564 ORGANISM="Thalassiosira punctigera, Strain Tpunct2005C2" /NCGR_SAMPLE_ID=MMETSP1067 /ASSEMBLY_ACC=CAM_ASM_000444 /LENGTH=876 /DNA_ID=CAMNT_0013318995 /DNA_START=77 /DNA_END=2707 /DNA_ORIENTATION=-
MTTEGLEHVDKFAALRQAAADAAASHVSGVDRNVEPPVDPESIASNVDSFQTRPFASDAANNYYNAMTTRTILKMSKKGGKRGILSKISWKRSGKKTNEECKKSRENRSNETEVEHAHGNASSKTDEAKIGDVGKRDKVGRNATIDFCRSVSPTKYPDKFSEKLTIYKSKSGSINGDKQTVAKSKGSDITAASSDHDKKSQKKERGISSDTVSKDDDKSSADSRTKSKPSSENSLKQFDFKVLNGSKSSAHKTSQSSLGSSPEALSRAIDGGNASETSKACSKDGSKVSSRGNSSDSISIRSKSSSKTSTKASPKAGSKSGSTASINSRDSGSHSVKSNVSKDTFKKSLKQLGSDAGPEEVNGLDNSSKVSMKSTKKAGLEILTTPHLPCKESRSANATASKKSLQKLFSEALAVSTTPEEAAEYLRAHDPAFQFLQGMDSVTKKSIVQHGKSMSKDVEDENEGEDEGPGVLTVPPVTSFEHHDILSTTSSVTHNTCGKSSSSVRSTDKGKRGSSLIKKNFTMMSIATEVVGKGSKANQNIRDDPAIDEQDASLEKAPLLATDEEAKTRSSDASTAASSTPSSAEERKCKEGDADDAAAMLDDDDASKETTTSKKPSKSKSKQSRLKHLSTRLSNAKDDTEETVFVHPSDDGNESKASKASSKVGSTVSSASRASSNASSMANSKASNKSSNRSNTEDDAEEVEESTESFHTTDGDNESKASKASNKASNKANGNSQSKSNSSLDLTDAFILAEAKCGVGAATQGANKDARSNTSVGKVEEVMTDARKLFDVLPTLDVAVTGEVEMLLDDMPATFDELSLGQGVSSSSSTQSNKSSGPNTEPVPDVSTILSWTDLANKSSIEKTHAPRKSKLMFWW